MIPKGNLLESEFWQTVKKGLSSESTLLTRVESSTSSITDVIGCRQGVVPFIELKVFHGNRLHFRNSQRIFIVNVTNVGGIAWVLARKDDTIFLYEGRPTVLSPSTSLPDKKSFYIKHEDLPIPTYFCHKPFKWPEVGDVIFRKQSGSL